MDGSVLEEKLSFKMLGLSFSSKLDWDSYIVSIDKTVSKKRRVLIHSKRFLSVEVALYLYKSNKRPCMENCFDVWAACPSCYMDMLYKSQKRVCRTVGLILVASPEPLDHRRNVASLSVFYRFYFGRCSSELVELVLLPHYSDRLHDFSVTIPRCYTVFYVNSFFPCTVRPWFSLSVECLPLTVNEEVHPANSGYLSSRHCSSLCMYVSKIVIIQIQVNHNMLCKRITLSIGLLLTGGIILSSNVTHN